MAYSLVIKEEAKQDILDACIYYDTKGPDLTEKFLHALEDRFHDLVEHPFHYGFIEEDSRKIYRDVSLNKFPYQVVFEIISFEVIVYAVHNTNLRPGKKTEHLL